MIRFTETYSGQTFDLLVIGGGITGATIAYEAALRGLKTALVEKKDFASATSAATSKMIHGGLRYLATGQLHLVRESLLERRILSNIAPNFVHPLPFVFAIYEHMNTPAWTMHTGMLLYELLSVGKTRPWDKDRKLPHFKHQPREKIIHEFPPIKTHGLKGGFLYYDCRNHFPERLTLAFIKSAVQYGAQVANYAQVTGFIHEKIKDKVKIKGTLVKDLITGRKLEIKAHLIVNAAGPWVDIVLSRLGQKSNIKHIRRSEGIHIIINKPLTKEKVFATQSPSGQHFFLIPFRGKTIIGTTDKEYTGDPDQYHVTRESVDELINKVNSILKPQHHITYKDIDYIYGGLRPLVEDSSTNVYNASRRYEIADEASKGIDGLISAEGGKFTTSRRLAEKVVDLALKKLKYDHIKSSSASKFLVTSRIPNLNDFIKQKIAQYPMLNPHQIKFLVYSYGTEIDHLMDIYQSNKNLQFIINNEGENLAQVVYAIRYEMARTLEDIIMRRTGIGWLGMPGEKILNQIAILAAKELNWSHQQMIEQIEKVKNLYTLVQTLKKHKNETKQNISATMD